MAGRGAQSSCAGVLMGGWALSTHVAGVMGGLCLHPDTPGHAVCLLRPPLPGGGPAPGEGGVAQGKRVVGQQQQELQHHHHPPPPAAAATCEKPEACGHGIKQVGRGAANVCCCGTHTPVPSQWFSIIVVSVTDCAAAACCCAVHPGPAGAAQQAWPGLPCQGVGAQGSR